MTHQSYHTTTQPEETPQSTAYQSNPETVWSEKTYAPWKNPVDRKNGRLAKKRSLQRWKRKQQARRL